MYHITLTLSNHATLGKAGEFDGSTSQMAVYATGPYSGGEPMTFSMWFKTDRSSAEMVLFNYGSVWDDAAISNTRDHFMLTLDYGAPAVRIQSKRRIKVSNNKMNLADGDWHQIAVSMPSKSCLLSEVEIYVDKERANTVLQGGDLNIFTHTAGRISLGGVGFYSRAYDKAYPNIDPFSDLLDDFRLWANTDKRNICDACE